MTAQPGSLFMLWAYLSTSPLLWLTATLGVFVVAQRLAKASGFNPLVNPTLVSVIIISALLYATGTSYGTYFEGAQFVHFALGPATVALAVPVYRHRLLVRKLALPVGAALVAGSATAIISSVVLAHALGATSSVLSALAPKSATAGVAVGIAEQVQADPTLTAAFVIFTGLFGAVIVTPLMNALRVRDYAARGFAAGVTSHGIGTARAFQVSDEAGTFAGLGMALNGVLTAILAPLLLPLLV